MNARHELEALAVGVLAAGARRLPWGAVRGWGAALGAAAGAAGVRRGVARDNLAHAFPDRPPRDRDRILSAHYRELGRVFLEYALIDRLVQEPGDSVLAELRGLEHLVAIRASGRGAILMSGHFGNVELACAFVARHHPVDVVVRPQSNAKVDAMLGELRSAAGLGAVRADAGVRQVYASLKAGRWVAMLADQDARRHGVFVPFLGRPASTPIGPARIALALNVPIVMGFLVRRADGRFELEVEPPLWGDASLGDDAVRDLTSRHVARLEHWVRRHPEQWFWLHRRWKTAPAAADGSGSEPGDL